MRGGLSDGPPIQMRRVTFAFGPRLKLTNALSEELQTISVSYIIYVNLSVRLWNCINCGNVIDWL